MNKTTLLITLTALSLGVMSGAQAKNDKDNHKQLPPGLQKKVESGKGLPPGWQKKLHIGGRLDDDIYDYGRVIHRDRDLGQVSIRVDGKIIRVIENTREIIDILGG